MQLRKLKRRNVSTTSSDLPTKFEEAQQIRAAQPAQPTISGPEALAAARERAMTGGDGLGSCAALAAAAAPLLPMTIEYPEGLFNLDNFVECDILVTLDSGCCEHVLDLLDAPGYQEVLPPSKGSIRGQKFVV